MPLFIFRMVQAAVEAYERRLRGEDVDLREHVQLLASETARIWTCVQESGVFGLIDRNKLRYAVRLEFQTKVDATGRVAVRAMNSAGIWSQIFVLKEHVSFVDCLVRFNTLRLRLHAERPVALAPSAGRRSFARYAGWLHSELARLMPAPRPHSQ